MNLQGVITNICEVQKVTSKNDKEWQKLTFAIEVKDGDYTNTIAFEIFGEDKVKEFKNKVGDEVDVNFNIRSNEWNGKYFTSLGAWKIETINEGQTEEPGEEQDHPF